MRFSLFSFRRFQVEIATLTRENDKTRIRILTEKEVNELIKQYDEEQARLEAEKLAKEKAAQGKWTKQIFI